MKMGQIAKGLASLKLAIFVLLSLVGALAAGTILESEYDIPTAQYFVYRAVWFHLLLGLLGANIFCVAMSRLPWKLRHIPFLLAHLGILVLLAGSWITERFGIDGNLRVTEGEVASAVENESSSLLVKDPANVYRIPVPWIPPSVKFKPITPGKSQVPYDLTIDRFIAHAEPVTAFVPDSGKKASAIHLKLVGGPMQISQEFWLWSGDPSWSRVQAGPAILSLGPAPLGHLNQPVFSVFSEEDGNLTYQAKSSSGKTVKGKIEKDRLVGKVIEPGWKGNLKIIVLEWIPHANIQTSYRPSRVLYGAMASSSAIHLIGGKEGSGVGAWLGLGDKTAFSGQALGLSHDVEVGYFPERVILPFSVRLERFTIDHYEGSRDPSSFSSKVTVLDQAGERSEIISMNEPLHHAGITLYQSSYEDAIPRPVTSIFSVNRDPGRIWKYTGSLLIVLGVISLFAAKYWRFSKASPQNAKAAKT